MEDNKTLNKEELLHALRVIRAEYRLDIHIVNYQNCSLCKLFYKRLQLCDTRCPMTVFSNPVTLSKGCLVRITVPVDSENMLIYYEKSRRAVKLRERQHKLKAVREFYNRAVKAISEMTEEELQADNRWDWLKKLDLEIAEKYALNINATWFDDGRL